MVAGLVLLSLSLIGYATCSPVFNVVDYGAVGDGQTYNTKAFTSTFLAAQAKGGGRVYVPPGKYLTNQFSFGDTSNLQWYIDSGAIILAPPDPLNWTGQLKSTTFITARNLSNFQILGGGTIDGQGLIWWQKYIDISRPKLFTLYTGDNILIENVQFHNSPAFHIELVGVNNTEISHVNIFAPSWTVNTDGIDPENCTNVYIHETNISNGDDHVAVKQGTRNVLVENCIFNYGRGAVIGSITGGVTQNITFRNITMFGGLHGVRLKTHPGCDGSVTNVTYENFKMVNVTYPISLFMFYPPPCTNRSTGIEVNNIIIRNITATEGTYAGQFLCSSGTPCKNIQLQNIHIEASEDPQFDCEDAYGTATNVFPASCLKL